MIRFSFSVFCSIPLFVILAPCYNSHMTHVSPSNPSADFGWGLFILLLVASILVVIGFPLGPLSIFGAVAALLFAYVYPYATFGLMVALIPFLGLFVHIPATAFPFVNRIFGGSVDMLFGELVAMAMLTVWAVKIIRLWIGRNDWNWKPWIPLAWPMAIIAATHLLSAFSVFQPDILFVIKYTIRPVLWSYLIYVLLTVNFIRSRRMLKMALGIVAVTGILSAVMGFVSLWFSSDAGQLFPRARPLSIFGVSLLGDNHNLLAEWLSVTILCSLALAFFSPSRQIKRLLGYAIALQTAVALLTFARSLWIVLAFEAACLAYLVWRKEVKQYLSYVIIACLVLLPLGILMTLFSSSALVQSSTSTRVMLTEIALNVWEESPWIGAGAGTFVERIGNTVLFVTEYGAPLDSHGWIQKLLAEVGLVGLGAVIWFFFRLFRAVRRMLSSLFPRASAERTILLILAVNVAGSVLYQLFNTNYWTGKLWFPIGLLLAAMRVFHSNADPRDLA